MDVEKVKATAAKYETEAEQDAYLRGYDHGRGIAGYNVPTLGESVHTEDMGRVTVTAENIRDVHASECYAAESNSRCYSPFEFTASEFNESDESETLWAAFEAGTGDAISDDLATYTDEDYGIGEDL